MAPNEAGALLPSWRDGSVAEWSKALVLGTSLFGGVGSNPTAAKYSVLWAETPLDAYGKHTLAPRHLKARDCVMMSGWPSGLRRQTQA